VKSGQWTGMGRHRRSLAGESYVDDLSIHAQAQAIARAERPTGWSTATSAGLISAPQVTRTSRPYVILFARPRLFVSSEGTGGLEP